MTPLPEKAEARNYDPLPLAELLTDLSILLAMQYRRAPLPIAPSMVRWFAGRSLDQVVNEVGSVVRRCLLLGDETMVLRELKRHRFTAHLAPARLRRAPQAECCPGMNAGAQLIPPVESSTSHKREGLNCESQ